MSRLWYQQPARDWNEALPFGNGRLGAIVYGRTDTELLQLNADSLWYGGPQDRTPQDDLGFLPRLRQAIREGNHSESEELATLAFFANPINQRHYEPLGTLFLDFGHKSEGIAGYQRSLDLEKAVAHVRYQYQGAHFQRETFAS